MKALFKRIIFSTFLICPMIASASPALQKPFSITLNNGEILTVVKCGNEKLHWLQTTTDQRLILGDKEKGYHLASESEKQIFMASSAKRFSQSGSFAPAATTFPTIGEMRSLVLLVNFSNLSFSSPTAQHDFQKMMNEEGYCENGGTGSARDYYIENSMGTFRPQFDVVGPVTVSQNYAYYGANNLNGADIRPTELIIEACQVADETVDFSQYDYDNDGMIDNVFVFYAGHGEASYDDDNTIWPHSYNIAEYTGTPIMLDGVRLNHYACTSELSNSGQMDGIGTFVHEFGHVLGLPDLYPTGYTTAFTPGSWSVMDAGEYNNDSRTPPYFSAYERYSLGWLEPLEISEAASVTLNDISENEGFIVKTANRNEYFLFENRQKTGWDSYIPGHGMLVWHIDYDQQTWRKNVVNNDPVHQHVDIIEADNSQTAMTRDGDAFPGAGRVTSFTAETTPAFKTFSGNAIDLPITNIREEDGIILFDVCGGGDPLEPFRYTVPVADEANDVEEYSFVANWQEVNEAEGYYLSLGKLIIGEEKEDIADFTGGVEALPDTWLTNVTSTYPNSSYSGNAMPSLRMQRAGDYILCRHENVYGVQFWCRGTNVKEGTMAEISWQDENNDWTEPTLYALTTTGTVCSYNAPEGHYKAVKISYSPAADAGSLALDDVCVRCSDNTFTPLHSDAYTTETSLQVKDLMPNTEYTYFVTAAKGTMRSKHSNYITVKTAETGASIDSVTNKEYRNRAFLHNGRVIIRHNNKEFTTEGKKW